MTNPAKRAHIVTCAGRIFAARGFEKTTLHTVARSSDAAIGSICHFFGSKPGLAAAVYDAAAERLVGAVAGALVGKQGHIHEAVPAMIRACGRHRAGHPLDRRILDALAPHVATPPGALTEAVETRLARQLATWADVFIKLGRIRPLEAAQLYAIVLAPVMHAPGEADEDRSGETAGAGAGLGEADRSDWRDALVAAALATLKPPPAVRMTAPKPPTPSAQSRVQPQ